MKVRNTFIIFIVSGFWHGANWTFIAWGFLNAIYFLPLLLSKTNRANIEIVAEGKTLPDWREVIRILVTFTLTVFAWIFFRSESISQALGYIGNIFINQNPFAIPYLFRSAILLILLISFLIIIEWNGREQQFGLARIGFKWAKSLRISFYLIISLLIFFFSGSEQQFIYFQF
jgi:D-alanyl-lipoteichoic acid acyltransferase DltB (MBOAT superfamily)